MTVINKKKYVVPPSGLDFKELFLYLSVAGAGKPQQMGDEAWDPEALCDAINMLPGVQEGKVVKIRAVRYWFQDNDTGIRSTSINQLATIFGCSDPERTSDMRVALRKSHALLVSRRHKDKQKTELEYAENKKWRFAHFSSDAFSGANALSLPVLVWLAGSVLLFLSYLLGAHSVTYLLSGGVPKEVGLFWSTSWILGELIFLPTAVMIASMMISDWVNDWSMSFIRSDALQSHQNWRRTVGKFSGVFYAVLAACFFVVFLFQWSGAYLQPFIVGENQSGMTDWLLVALETEQNGSIILAAFVSLYGFLYSGLIYWFLFTSILLVYIVTYDFLNGCHNKKQGGDLSDAEVLNIGRKLFYSVYLVVTLGVSVATTLRINAAYLISDSSSFSAWLYNDFSTFFGRNVHSWTWLDGSPLPYLTSFMLMVIISFVGVFCMLNIRNGLASALDRNDFNLPMKLWYVSLAIQLTCHLLIGLFYGFAALFLVGVSSVVFITITLYLKVNNDVK